MTILEALEHIYMGDIYDDKGYLTEKGYLILQTLEGVKLTETVKLTQQPEILFVCDGEACDGKCSNIYCCHISKIEHAKNFINISPPNETPIYFENEKLKGKNEHQENQN